MSSVAETRTLFVPYRPSQTSKAPTDESEISLQRHAAREYHRKAKLLRQANTPRTRKSRRRVQNKKTRTLQGEDLQVSCIGGDAEAPSHRPRQKFPGMNTFRIKQDTTSGSYLLPHDVGAGVLDPFNVSVRWDVPRYVQEMLDHGKPARGNNFYCLILHTTLVGGLSDAAPSTQPSP